MASQADTERAARTAPKDRSDEQNRIVNQAIADGRVDIKNLNYDAEQKARFGG